MGGLRKNSRKKGQVSMEYLAIFSIAALMTLPLILIFAVQSNNIQTDITTSQAQKVGSTIIASAQQVYYMGEPAQKTISLQFPKGIQAVEINNNSLNFSIETSDYTYVVAKTTKFPMSGNIRSFEGTHTLIFKAQQNELTQETFVNITDVE